MIHKIRRILRNALNRSIREVIAFSAVITIIYAATFLLADFSDSPFAGARDLAVLMIQGATVCVATFLLFFIISINRWVFAVTFPIVTVLCTILAYFKLTASTVLTPQLIELTIVNDAQTASEMVSPLLIATTAMALVLSILAIWWRFRRMRQITKSPGIIITATLLLTLMLTNPRLKAPVEARMPFNLYACTREYLLSRRNAQTERDGFNSIPAGSDSDPLTVILIIGESLRADHLGINGYGRQTTPMLARERNLVSLPNVYSEHIYTHLSIPHILTRADSTDMELAYTEPSLITLMRKAGFRASWIANQEPVNTYSYFMHEGDTLIYANRNSSVYTFTEFLDGATLGPLAKELADTARKKLVIIHTIGSHWYYNSHCPENMRRYTPVTRSRVLSACTREEMINSYDNTILYSDRYWSSVINAVRNSNSIVFYLSDHGEALGENGKFLHGSDAAPIHRPAAFIWWSDSYAQKYPHRIKSLKENATRNIRTDYLFHSLLDGAGIATPAIDSTLSIFH